MLEASKNVSSLNLFAKLNWKTLFFDTNMQNVSGLLSDSLDHMSLESVSKIFDRHRTLLSRTDKDLPKLFFW